MSRLGDRRYAYRVLVGRLEGRRRCRWEDDSKMDHQEVRWAGVNWIGVVQDMNRWQALVNAVMNIRAPKNAGIFLLAEDLLASQEGLYLMELLVICFPREVSRCAVGKETVGRCVYTSVFFFRNLASYPRQI